MDSKQSLDASQKIRDNWEDIKQALKRDFELMNVTYDTWIAPLKFHKVEDNVVYIIIPTDKSMQLGYIKKKYEEFLKVTISEYMNHEYDVEFQLEKDIEETTKLESQRIGSRQQSQKALESNLIEKYKFDTFIVGSNNKLAHAAALAVAESPGDIYNPLFIYGGAGLGKTHLMHSIGHFVLEQNNDMKVLYVTSEAFTNEVIDSIRSGNATAMTKLRDKYRTVDVLLVDDVQFIIGKESTQEEFFNTFNALHQSGKQVILSSDKPPKEMETLEERFRSRFEWGLIADIQPPDYETRMAILQKNAETYNMSIDNAIIEYIATNIKSNIRELEGALNKVIARARLEKKDITLELAQDALSDIIYPEQPKEITPELILDVVSEHFKVPKEMILSKSRSSEHVMPRHVFIYLCKEMTGASQTAIAKLVNRDDHTTVINAVNSIKKKQEKDPELKNKIDIIRKKISPS